MLQLAHSLLKRKKYCEPEPAPVWGPCLDFVTEKTGYAAHTMHTMHTMRLFVDPIWISVWLLRRTRPVLALLVSCASSGSLIQSMKIEIALFKRPIPYVINFDITEGLE